MARPGVWSLRSAQALQASAVVAAVVLAGIANVLGARHFTRWDWTADRRWSPSPATVETLRTLEQPVDVWVIAGRGEPIEQSLRQLLLAYRAETTRLDVHWIDPDRDAVQLLDLRQRFGLEAGRTEDGRVAADATVVVASGERRWFLTPQDLFESADDVHVRPNEERALTQAIRAVLGGARPRLCFTTGHGELSLDPTRDEREGLGAIRDLLDKSNYDLASVELAGPGVDPLAGCTAAVVAGPRAPFGADETERLRAWLDAGGNLFAALGPLEGSGGAVEDPGLGGALGEFGIAVGQGVLHDVDPKDAIPETHGEGFFVQPRVHAVTASLVPGGPEVHPPRVAVFLTRGLSHAAPPGSAPALDLLVTSDAAYEKRSLAGAAAWREAPSREPGDAAGPFVVAMASERPRVHPDAPHGPRAVVVGSRFVLAEDNWRQPRPLHGAAFFVDAALSWLVSRPPVVDVPPKAEVAAGMRVSDEGRAEVQRYVLLFMPFAALLLGLAVWATRRAAESKPYERPKA